MYTESDAVERANDAFDRGDAIRLRYPGRLELPADFRNLSELKSLRSTLIALDKALATSGLQIVSIYRDGGGDELIVPIVPVRDDGAQSTLLAPDVNVTQAIEQMEATARMLRDHGLCNTSHLDPEQVDVVESVVELSKAMIQDGVTLALVGGSQRDAIIEDLASVDLIYDVADQQIVAHVIYVDAVRNRLYLDNDFLIERIGEKLQSLETGDRVTLKVRPTKRKIHLRIAELQDLVAVEPSIPCASHCATP